MVMVGCLGHGNKEKDKRDGIFKDSLTKETTQGSLVNNFKIMKLTKTRLMNDLKGVFAFSNCKRREQKCELFLVDPEKLHVL